MLEKSILFVNNLNFDGSDYLKHTFWFVLLTSLIEIVVTSNMEASVKFYALTTNQEHLTYLACLRLLAPPRLRRKTVTFIQLASTFRNL